MLKEIRINRTKKGFTAIWEEGGGMTNTGFAQIVANSDGSPKSPLYTRQRGSLANAEHALFCVQPGDLIIQVDHHRGDYEIFVLRYDGENGEYAKTTTLAHYSLGEWDRTELGEEFERFQKGLVFSIDDTHHPILLAVYAAMSKATCYHCRKPHFIKTE